MLGFEGTPGTTRSPPGLRFAERPVGLTPLACQLHVVSTTGQTDGRGGNGGYGHGTVRGSRRETRGGNACDVHRAGRRGFQLLFRVGDGGRGACLARRVPGTASPTSTQHLRRRFLVSSEIGKEGCSECEGVGAECSPGERRAHWLPGSQSRESWSASEMSVTITIGPWSVTWARMNRKTGKRWPAIRRLSSG